MEVKVKELIDKAAYDEALELLSKELDKNPDNDEALYLRGYLYKQLGRWGESLTDLDKAVTINPDSRAAVLRNMLREIISYRYTDIYNP